MSQTKYRLPSDLKDLCLSFVRGYDRRVKLYHGRRHDVIYASSTSKVISSIGKDGKETGEFIGRGSDVGDPTHDRVVRLEKIEGLQDTKIMRAVEQAKLTIGTDWDETQRQRLINAIWDSCNEGRNFILEYYNLPIGKDNFYEHRRRFLWNIAKNMGFI